MNDLKAVIEIRSLAAKCNLDPCFIKLILKQTRQDLPVDAGKLESRKELVLRNGKVDINESFELQVQPTALRDNKVTVIVMASKGKDVSLLGVANIDFRKINTSVNNTQLDLPLEKCSDSKAELSTRVRFSEKQQPSSQQTSDVERPKEFVRGSMRSDRTAPNPSTNSEVPSVKKLEQIQSAPNTSRQKALEISRRNYKQTQILRDSKKEKEQSRDRSGSYKKRFEYQQKVTIASKNTTTLFTKKAQGEKQLVPRQRTPEPIKFDGVGGNTNTTSRRESRSKSKIKEGAFSLVKEKEKEKKVVPTIQKENIMGLVQQQSPQHENKKDLKTLSPPKVVRFADRDHSQAGSIKHQRSPSLERKRSPQKERSDKYAMLADKLQQIEQRLQREKISMQTATNQFHTQPSQKSSPSPSQHSPIQPNNPTQNSICTFGESQQEARKFNEYCSQSIPSVKIESSKIEPSKEQQTQSLKTSMELVSLNREYERERQERVKLQEALEQAERKIEELEEEKHEAEKVMDKLVRRYELCLEKHAKEIDEIKESYERNLDKQAEETDKVKNQLRKFKVENDELKAQLASAAQMTPLQPSSVTTTAPTLPEERLSRQRVSQIEAQLQKQKRQVNNLTTNIKFLQNELKFAKLREDSLQGEKRQLEQEIKKLESKSMVRKQSRAELQQQFLSGYPTTLRAENKLLREQIELLQRHSDELNAILQQREKQRTSSLSNTICTVHEQTIAEKNAQILKLKESNKILQEKYNALLEKTQVIEEDLIRTKNNFCQAMNAAFEKGGSELVEILESKMTTT